MDCSSVAHGILALSPERAPETSSQECLDPNYFRLELVLGVQAPEG